VQPGGDQKTWRFIGGGWDAWKDGRWQHVAFTFKPGEQTIYFDGQLDERKSTDLFEPVFEDDISITLAKANKGQAQVFDEVILFRRALSEQEIRSLARPPRELTDLLQIPEMKPPTVDGKDTSENEWESANALNDWIDPVLGTVNRDSTEVRVGHSDDKLYVRFLYRIPKIFREQRDLYVGAPLKTDIDQPDGSIFQDDYVGIYLSAPNSQDTCFFGVNGTDTKRDDKNGDPSWNGTWSVRQSQDDHRWIVEFAIPLAAIGADTATGAPWGINFAHGCRQLNHDDGIWHYQPRRQRPLAHMRLATTSTSVHLQGMQSIAQGKFSFQGRIINRDDVPLSAHGRLCIQGADGKPVLETPLGPFSAKPGSAEHFEVEHTLSGPICGKVGLLLEDSAENLLIRKTLPFVYSREMSFFTRYYPSSARLEAVIDAGSSTMLANITSAAISLVPGDGKEPMHMVSIRELNGLQHEETIDCSGIPVGKYEIVADIRTGETATILKDRLEKKALPEWLGNDLGTFQSVPDPYTPLERTDRTVTCWGREYTFGPACLPAQVRILDKDILASPARLLVTADGQTQTMPLGDFEVSAETGLKMAFSSHAKLEELDVSARAWIGSQRGIGSDVVPVRRGAVHRSKLQTGGMPGWAGRGEVLEEFD